MSEKLGLTDADDVVNMFTTGNRIKGKDEFFVYLDQHDSYVRIPCGNEHTYSDHVFKYSYDEANKIMVKEQIADADELERLFTVY